MKYENIAKEFTQAIKEIAEKSENLENFELYLAHHFEMWLEKFANTPESITAEIKAFAKVSV